MMSVSEETGTSEEARAHLDGVLASVLVHPVLVAVDERDADFLGELREALDERQASEGAGAKENANRILIGKATVSLDTRNSRRGTKLGTYLATTGKTDHLGEIVGKVVTVRLVRKGAKPLSGVFSNEKDAPGTEFSDHAERGMARLDRTRET